MTKTPKNISSDLQGVNKITNDAIKGVTNIVESLHATIAEVTPTVSNPKDKTKGLSSLIYRSIRTIADVVSKSIDTILAKFTHLIADQKSPKIREALNAALNGIIGDYLAKKNNPLAIEMSFRINGETLSKDELQQFVSNSQSKILILIHGLCMNDLHWLKQNHSHGEKLAKELNYSTLYLHYNSGKHVSENGKELNELLKVFSDSDRLLTFVGHSMGGLVTRSACYYAQKSKAKWLNQLDKMIFLGTPHHGAILEKTGNWINIMLKASPYTAPFTKITSIRSCGITDLRYGNICDEDWINHDRFEHANDKKHFIPLPTTVECYSIAATVSNESTQVQENIIGDGLVTINSAMGIHKDSKQCLNFDNNNTWIVRNINHNQLLSSKQVYKQLRNWLK